MSDCFWGCGFNVVSDWDETARGFEDPLVTKSERTPKQGDVALEIMLEKTSKEMSKAETLVRSQSVVARVVAGETLIVPIRAKVGDLASIYSFNGTGTLIWQLLESPRTMAQLATAVAESYQVDPAQGRSRSCNEFCE